MRFSRHMPRMVFIAFVLAIALPMVALGQGRGRGRGRGPDPDKKCGKFVNCHDARDGRWDSRGPRQSDFRRGAFTERHERHRGFRHFEADNRFRSRRWSHRNRHFHRDPFSRRRY